MDKIINEFLILFRPEVRGSGFQRLNKQFKNTYGDLFNLKKLFTTFIGYDVYTGIKSLFGGLVQASKDLGAMHSRFYAITESNQLANEELEWTFKLAERTAMSLKATADSYSIFYAATQKSLGTSGARQVFQDWTEVSRVLHLSEYQFERVTYALREMASKGAIYSQDLRMQIGTHVPNALGLAQKAAEELGITGNNWFKDLQEASKGNQKLINQFIVLFSKFAKQAYASPEALVEALKKPDAQLQMLFNNWQKFQYAIVKSGFEKDLVSVLQKVNYLLAEIAKHADAVYSITKALIGLFLTISGLKLIKTFLGLRWVQSFITAFKFLSKTQGALTALTNLLKGGALLAFGTMFKGSGIGLLLAALSNPYILGAVLIIAGVKFLDWVLKKFFPNVHLAIENIIIWIKEEIWQIVNGFKNSPIGQLLGLNFKPTNPTDVIKEKRQDIKKTGGFYGNTEYGNFGDVWKLNSALNQAEKILSVVNKAQPKNAEAKALQQQITVQLSMNVEQAENAQDIIEGMKAVEPQLEQFWKTVFKK